ncbi:MAG TPA: COX15/CtaA family protein [Pseudomonadales bacterium]|nr:COX15/CtaA family protein [Pseudomonadales bacterium]
MDNIRTQKWLLILTCLATLLAFGVVKLGAWTRLSNAGLGCPDWPTCYGFIAVPSHPDKVEIANAAFPDRPLVQAKAWPEMIHRYFASTLGSLIVVIGVASVILRKQPKHPLLHPLLLVALVIFQGLLGKWTVTIKLFPPVVMSHLLGGFTTLSLLFLLSLRFANAFITPTYSGAEKFYKWALAGIAILALQIALGGWTAANYAATVCTDLPICQHGWSQVLNLADAFKFWGHDVSDYEYAPHLAADAKITIHVLHRFGAIVTGLYLLGLGLMLLTTQKAPRYQRFGLVLLTVLITQISLGVSNVLFQLPLAVAVAHNAVAAVLMLVLIALSFSLYNEKNTRA